MKKIFLLLNALLSASYLGAGINFGSRESAIEVQSSGTVTMEESPALTNGTLRNTGGSLYIGETSSKATVAGMTIVNQDADTGTHNEYRADGRLWLDGTASNNALTLGDGQVLIVDGGQVTANVDVNSASSAPAVIQGHGSFDNTITINDAKVGKVQWQGSLNQDIHLTPTTVSTTSQLTLGDDLAMGVDSSGNGCGITIETGGSGTAKVDFNGYKLSFDKGATVAETQTWSKANVEFRGDATVSGTLTLDTANPYFNGGGNDVTLTGTMTLASGLDGTFANATILNYGGSYLASGNANDVWTLDNVTIKNANNTAGIYVLAGGLDGTASDIFGVSVGATWIGATDITLLRDLSLDGDGWSSSGLTINGNGYTMSLEDGVIGDNDQTFTLNNLTLTGLSGEGTNGNAGTTWNMNNVTIQSNGATAIVDGSMSTGIIDFGAQDVTWGANTKVRLLSNIAIASQFTWTTAGLLEINGNNHTIDLGAEDSELIIDFEGNIALTDVHLARLQANNFKNDNANNHRLLLQNVSFDMAVSELSDEVAGGAMRISASPFVAGSTAANLSLPASTSLAGDLLDQALTWNNGASLELLSATVLTNTWEFSANTIFNGNGQMLSLLDGKLKTTADDDNLYLRDIILSDVNATSFNLASDQSNSSLFLNNVVWISDDGATGVGAMRIMAGTSGSDTLSANLELPAGTDSGDIFNEAAIWKNGANIELLKNSTLKSTWTFDDNTVIDGGGASLDVNSGNGIFKIANGKTLTLQNMVLSNIHADTLFSGTGYETGTLILSNVTVKMDADVSWSSKGTDLTINGPVTFVTGSFNFTPQSSGSTIDGVTVWYDGLGKGGVVSDFATKNDDGRVAAIAESSTGSVLYTPTANNVGDSLFLNYAVTSGSAGKQVDITNSSSWGTTELEGNGRSWYFGDTGENTTGFLVNISGGEVVTVNDLVIDNFNQGAIENNSEIKFGNGCLLRLNEDTALTAGLLLAGTESGEGITIDLCGNELDLGGQTVTITDTDATVTFKNGRITNATGQPFAYTDGDFDGCTNTLVFEDVELVVSGATTFSAAATTFNGSSSITGKSDQTVSFFNSAITIAAGATLTVDEGITIMLDEGDGSGHNAAAVDSSISFGSSNSTLNLMGATMNTDLGTAPILQSGTVRIDDQVTFSGDWTVYQDTLDVDIAPGASLIVPTSATFTTQDTP